MKVTLIAVLLFFILGTVYAKVIVKDNTDVSKDMVDCTHRTLAGWPEPAQRLLLEFGKYVIRGAISSDTVIVSETTLWGIQFQKLAVRCDRSVKAITN